MMKFANNKTSLNGGHARHVLLVRGLVVLRHRPRLVHRRDDHVPSVQRALAPQPDEPNLRGSVAD